jgi:hypothetical protein
MKPASKILIPILVFFCALSVVILVKGCGTPGNGSPENTRVVINLGSLDAQGIVQASSNVFTEDIPLGITALIVSVSGSKMEDIIKRVELTGQTEVIISLNIPSGPARHFIVHAINNKNTVLWEGSSTADLAGSTVNVVIIMTFLMDNDTEPPTEPTGITLTLLSGSGIELSWNPSSDNSSVAGYYVYEVINDIPYLIKSTKGTSFTDEDLAPGTYCYQVSAVDAAGNESSLSPKTCITIPLPPNGQPLPPSEISVTSVSNTTASLVWTGPEGAGTLAGYNIYEVPGTLPGGETSTSLEQGQAPRFITYSTTNSAVDTRIIPGIYCYAVSSVTPAGVESALSGEACTTLNGTQDPNPNDTDPPAPPGAPIVNAVSPYTLEIQWTAPEIGGPLSGYNIYEMTDGVSRYITSSTSTQGFDTRYSPGTYCYAISAVDMSNNESGLTETVCGTFADGGDTGPRNPRCPEFLTFYTNPGGNYKWHPDSNPPKCYGEVPPPRTWKQKPH